MSCPEGHDTMVVAGRFRFDHELGDSVRDTEALRRLTAIGVELGAAVTVWRCETCGHLVAEFDYEEEEP